MGLPRSATAPTCRRSSSSRKPVTDQVARSSPARPPSEPPRSCSGRKAYGASRCRAVATSERRIGTLSAVSHCQHVAATRQAFAALPSRTARLSAMERSGGAWRADRQRNKTRAPDGSSRRAGIKAKLGRWRAPPLLSPGALAGRVRPRPSRRQSRCRARRAVIHQEKEKGDRQ